MLNIGSCGIDCSQCAAYKATQEGDTEKLSELAASWGGDKGFTAKDMLCDGCTSNRVYKNVPECTVYKCVRENDVKVCSQCGIYSCEKLETLWTNYSLDFDQMKDNLAKAK
jgi:hypothetical protein